MPATSLPVEFLCTLTATLGPPLAIGARVIVPVTGGTFDGPRMKGTIHGDAGGDWVTARPDGSIRLDVRVTLTTDDGALIYASYGGVGVVSGNGRALRTAPLFETADPRYSWLNNVQAVGIGSTGQDAVSYEIYALSI